MNNGNTGNYQVLLQGVTWTDGVTTNIPSLSPSIMMPIASQNVIGLSSGTTPPVSVPAPTVTISANPITITAGQSTTLTWSSTNATTCTASGATGNVWSGAVATAGSQTVTPVNNPGLLPYSIGYTITCNGTGGTSNPSSVSVQVNAPAVPAPTTSSIAPSQGTVNTSVTLSGANLSGITSIEFVNPSGQVVGSLTNPLSISSTNTSATFVIPSVFEAMVGPGTYQVEVVTSAGTSNGQSFVMVAPSPVYSCTNTSAACQNQSACTSVGSCSVGSCSASNCAVPQQYGGCGGTWIPGCNGAWVAGGTSMNVQTPAMINQTAIISQSLKGLLNQLSALLKSL